MPWKTAKRLIFGCLLALLPATAFAQEAPRVCTREDYARSYDVRKLLYQVASPVFKAGVGLLNITATHRGNWRDHPDNSMSAYVSAYERGDEILEVDVRVSND